MKRNRIIALAIAIVMCLPSIAFANSQELNGNGALVNSNPDESVKAAISKNLLLSVGTVTPNTTFLFHAKGISVDGDISQEVVAGMPDLTKNLKVSFSEALTGTPDGNNIVSIIRETEDIFDGITFDEPGVYVYEITELPETTTGIEENEPYESLTFSKAVYTISVYVAWNSDRTATVIYGVGTRVNVPDVSGEQVQDKKIDATPGGDGDRYDHSQLIFTNTYVKTNAPIDPENPDFATESTLYVSKLVTGNMGLLTQYFDFEIELTVPAIIENKPAFYRAYIVENNVVVNPSENAAGSPMGTDAVGTYIEISTLGVTKFKLKDGQRLAFIDTPVGTGYIAKEELVEGYIQTVQVTTNAIAGDIIPVVDDNPLSTGPQLVGEKLNRAAFTNNRDSAAPMGIDLNNLPFIGLILLTIVGLIGFVVVKSRRRRYAVEK